LISLSLEREPLKAGVARGLDLTVANGSSEHVLLEHATLEPGRASFAEREALSWRRFPDGVLLYDAQGDRYVHETEEQGVSSVALHLGLVPPGARAGALVRCRLPRSARVLVSVSYRVLPSIEGRVYSTPRGVAGRRTVYSPGFTPGPTIVRASDLPLAVVRVELDLEVEGEVPAKAIGRSRALGWIEDGFSASGRRVSPEVIDALDVLLPDEPIVVLFRGSGGERVRRSLSLETNPAGQSALDYERALELIEACAREDAPLAVGLPWEGLVVG